MAIGLKAAPADALPSAVTHTYTEGRKYFGGFYFYLDVVATLTLLLDIKEARISIIVA